MRTLLLCALILLAGCAGDRAPEPGPTAPTDTTGLPSVNEPETPATPQVPDHGTCDITVTAAMAEGFGYSDASDCDAAEATGVAVAGHEAAVIELEWSDLQATVASISIEVHGNGTNAGSTWNTLAGAYASPLKLVLHADDMANLAGEMQVVVRVDGTAAQQAFTVHLSLFALDDVDEAYTAVGS